jgi:coproporphyrinogen III oxidase
MHDQSPDIPAVRAYFTGLQYRIVAALERFDGVAFVHDRWRRSDGATPGEGLSCVIENGAFFERGGCNFSHVRGERMPASGTAERTALAGRPFEALGVSLVLHPRNPYCPITHMNVRMFVALPRPGRDEPASFWFGGGMDLTPIYGFEQDCRHFHTVCRTALAPFGEDCYRGFKLWCDEYFYLRHRNEARGVGGIFYDDLSEGGFATCFALTRAVGDAFLDAYLPIARRRRDIAYGEREREFQAYRRGRYAEFNLALDRGTQFGLHGGGRIESILVSMPPTAAWRYDWRPEPGTPEARLYSDFLPPRDWCAQTCPDAGVQTRFAGSAASAAAAPSFR